MTTLTLEISDTLDEKVTDVAKRSKLSKEKLAEKALQDFVERQAKNGSTPKTVAELAGHLFGKIDVEVSTSRDYLGGFGE